MLLGLPSGPALPMGYWSLRSPRPGTDPGQVGTGPGPGQPEAWLQQVRVVCTEFHLRRGRSIS